MASLVSIKARLSKIGQDILVGSSTHSDVLYPRKDESFIYIVLPFNLLFSSSNFPFFHMAANLSYLLL